MSTNIYDINFDSPSEHYMYTHGVPVEEILRQRQVNMSVATVGVVERRDAKKKTTHEVEYDLDHYRWDTRRCRFVPIHTKRENENMSTKCKIVPYNAAGEIIQRGAMWYPSDIGQIQLNEKLAHSYHRCPKDGDNAVVKIEVLDAEDKVVKEWVAGRDEPPGVPESKAPPVEEKTEQEKSATKAKTKAPAGKRAVAGKDPPKAKEVSVKKGKTTPPKAAATAAKKNKPGGPGVISSFTEILQGAKKLGGMTVDEMLAKLAKKFPDRKLDSMRSTVKTQLGRQGAKKRADDKRGTVYFL